MKQTCSSPRLLLVGVSSLQWKGKLGQRHIKLHSRGKDFDWTSSDMCRDTLEDLREWRHELDFYKIILAMAWQ